jgi:hypothetical protein
MLTARTTTRSTLAEKSSLASAREERMAETPRKLTSWMGDDRVTTTESFVQMNGKDTRAKARKIRDRIAREMRAYIDSIEGELASQGRPSEVPARKKSASRDAAGAVRSEQHRDGAKLASYLDGSYHDRDDIAMYNEHVARKMMSIIAEEEAQGDEHVETSHETLSGNDRVPVELPDAASFVLPAEAEGNGASPQKKGAAKGSGHKGYNARALHSAGKVMSHAAFTDVNFSSGFIPTRD